MNRKYDRPEIKTISKQWVRENCKNITERDMGLLRVLLQHNRRLLRRDQLERLYPKFASTDRLNKRLSTLYRMHVIDKIYPSVGLGEGSSKQHICLDRAGIILLDLEKYNKPIQTDGQGNRRLPLGWEHKVMLNEYECNIREVVQEVGGKLEAYEVEQPHQFGDIKLIPDMFCLVTNNGKGYPFFIEVDLGTEDIPYVKEKMDNYISYYMSKVWLNREWVKLFKKPPFPRILLFTLPDRKKRQNALQDHIGESGLRFVIGGHSDFKETFRDIIKG